MDGSATVPSYTQLERHRVHMKANGAVAEVIDGREVNIWSAGWKDVTMKLMGSDEQIILPLMISTKVWDVKCLLAEMVGDIHPTSIEILFKLGPSYKKHKNGDEIQRHVFVRGLQSFGKQVMVWPHPYLIIGAGHMGLRQAVHYVRNKLDYVVFERKHDIGGNAWLTIANKTSKLQTEGAQYQLQYDPIDGGTKALLSLEQYPLWPTRGQILQHFRDICDQYGITPYVQCSCEITEMSITPEPWKGADIRMKHYNMKWESRDENSQAEGVFTCSNLCCFPGCLVVPHRKTWPGEDIFGGQIGYGFSHEFDYTKVVEQDVVLIGMGAFAHENVRTVVEHGGRKVFNIARHFNLMLPRVVCWWINQSNIAPTAAMVLHGMKSMYKYVGWDPFNFFAVSSNPERTVATIKQYTRWGVSDVYFLALYFGKAEIIEGEVKRFKERCAVLTTGRILTDVDHVIKVIGFDGDFNVDRLMQTKEMHGPWPDADFRRFVISDQSAIDAGRFGNINLSPPLASFTVWSLWYHQHPLDAFGLLQSGMVPTNRAEPQVGSPAYHWAPRAGTTFCIILSGAIPSIQDFEAENQLLKKNSIHALCGPEVFVKHCRDEWNWYCQLFQDQGITKEWPAYPYTVEDAERFVQMEKELGQQEEKQRTAKQLAERSSPGGEENTGQAWTMPALLPRSKESMYPAAQVLKAAIRHSGQASSEKDCRAWLEEGHSVMRNMGVALPASPRKALEE